MTRLQVLLIFIAGFGAAQICDRQPFGVQVLKPSCVIAGDVIGEGR